MTEKCAICDKEAVQKCSACKRVRYCSREHQKQHWKEHKKICQPFEVCQSDDLGRYMKAVRDINAGDVILMETPLVFGPKVYAIEQGPVPCLGCFKHVFLDSAYRCTHCRWPVCSQSCPGLKAPEKHGIECILLSMRKTKEPPNYSYNYFKYDSLFVLRCFLLQTRWPQKFRTLMNFESHLESRGPDTETYRITQERTIQYLQEQFIQPFKDYEKNVKNTFLNDTSDALFHKIAGIIDVNCFEISNEVEISAIYEQACLMEHNCTPNTIYTFDSADNDFRITVRAATKIPKGEHISISYTNLLWGTFARIQHLNETKYFTCQCRRCQDPTEFQTYFSALKCSGIHSSKCTGLLLPVNPCDLLSDWICNTCSEITSAAVIVKIIHDIGKGVEKLQNDTPTIGELELFIAKISTTLHSNHYHCFAVKHSLVQLYGYQQGYLAYQLSDELLEKKICLSNSLISITETLDPAHSRINLYSSILYHELHLSKMQLLKRKWHQEPENLVKDQLNDIANLIKKSLELLTYEQSTTAGQKLFDVINETSRSFQRWINDKDFYLTD